MKLRSFNYRKRAVNIQGKKRGLMRISVIQAGNPPDCRECRKVKAITL